jgi:hypothetical protein
VPIPNNRIIQIGNLILKKIDEIPPGAVPVQIERLPDGGIPIGDGYVLYPKDKE